MGRSAQSHPRKPDRKYVVGHGVARSVSWGEYATDTGNQEDQMDQAGIVTLIDEALERFAGRDIVSSAEVLDLLLDMRSAAVSDAAIAALIDAEAQPAH